MAPQWCRVGSTAVGASPPRRRVPAWIIGLQAMGGRKTAQAGEGDRDEAPWDADHDAVRKVLLRPGRQDVPLSVGGQLLCGEPVPPGLSRRPARQGVDYRLPEGARGHPGHAAGVVGASRPSGVPVGVPCHAPGVGQALGEFTYG